jgi:hypothetical protein
MLTDRCRQIFNQADRRGTVVGCPTMNYVSVRKWFYVAWDGVESTEPWAEGELTHARERFPLENNFL